MHDENLLRNTVMKKESKKRFSGTKNVREILYFLYSMARCTFCLVVVTMFSCGPLPTAHTHTHKIHASVDYSDILELNFPFWEKIYGRPYVMIYRPFRSQWLIEVPPSLTTKNSTSCQQSAFANSL